MNLEKFTPLTVVRVLKNIDFDNSYTDVMDFDTVQAQTSFFQSKTNFWGINVLLFPLCNEE